MKTFLLSMVAAAALAFTAGPAVAQYPVQPACHTAGACVGSGCGLGHGGHLSGLAHGGFLKGGCLHGQCGDGKLGWHPLLHKRGWGSCAHGGCTHGLLGGTFHGKWLGHGGLLGIGGGLGGGFGGAGNTLPVADPRNGGQLVFPQNPFVRGPRDFFMVD
jgi:hypothetical protein